MATIPMIAAGHNNLDDLERWDKLDAPCRFPSFGTHIPQEWSTQENRELSGDQRFRRIGKPFAVLIFPMLYEEDLKYIIDNFTLGREDGLVTINVYNRDEVRWMYANATLVLPEDRNFDLERGYYVDFRLEFRKITEIT